ncbi:HD domain-containing protein [Cytophagales bacterium LB-30]|uniref:HD domain-containing protein n=1 Tax=Shiella aurantiaca TaxID=3058365 RepID=A0ABT8F637_9BACT|nr:HD domain-containing protein [Shiella aurantiaca]MDN4165441.1 HD domain-containing protein [Shiella aurantiaca]
MAKKKIFSDPLYGFITVNDDLIYQIIEHPYFQRLRRIKQLGLTDYVYPGALHTRFHHAMGAMHLMGNALDSLRSKGHMISPEEYQAAQIAILLHDVGHGPFSHTLEFSLIKSLHHEELSLLLMKSLNEQFKGKLDMAIAIFTNTYHRKFLHSLVSSQLDIDRLDYLNRDCFFTGVFEGTIGVNRIIEMLSIENDELVVEEKGIYSIENFLGARRLMYWQVYLHKTAVSAEKMLTLFIKRAKYLVQKGHYVEGSAALKYFLQNPVRFDILTTQEEVLRHYLALDDFDIWSAIKSAENHPDKVLSYLASSLLGRQLFTIKLGPNPSSKEEISKVKQSIAQQMQVSENEAEFLIDKGVLSNSAYLMEKQKINIRLKSGAIVEITKASDLPNIKAMSKIVRKNYLCWPKSVTLQD